MLPAGFCTYCSELVLQTMLLSRAVAIALVMLLSTSFSGKSDKSSSVYLGHSSALYAFNLLLHKPIPATNESRNLKLGFSP